MEHKILPNLFLSQLVSNCKMQVIFKNDAITL